MAASAERSLMLLPPAVDPAVDPAMLSRLPELRAPGDDWTGMSSSAERKKLQNRLNQRAWRRRKKLERLREKQSLETEASKDDAMKDDASKDNDSKNGPASPAELLRLFHGHDMMDDPQTKQAIVDHLKRACQEYALRLHRPNSLPFLIRLNLLDGMYRNARLLGIPHDGLCGDANLSPFAFPGAPSPRQASTLAGAPRCLLPTVEQRRVLHHPWIDLVPFPAFRDNLLRAVDAGAVDDDDVCADLVDMGGVETDIVARPAMIVWGDASDAGAYEVNVSFLRKWGFLLRGCPEIIAATNAWRARRGEQPVVVEL